MDLSKYFICYIPKDDRMCCCFYPGEQVTGIRIKRNKETDNIL